MDCSTVVEGMSSLTALLALYVNITQTAGMCTTFEVGLNMAK